MKKRKTMRFWAHQLQCWELTNEYTEKRRKIKLTMVESGACESCVFKVPSFNGYRCYGAFKALTPYTHTINVLKMRKKKFIHSIHTLSSSFSLVSSHNFSQFLLFVNRTRTHTRQDNSFFYFWGLCSLIYIIPWPTNMVK